MAEQLQKHEQVSNAMTLIDLNVTVEPEMDDLVKVQRFAMQNFKSPDLMAQLNGA